MLILSIFFLITRIGNLQCVYLVFIKINKLNTDLALIQMKRLEKVQHFDSAQTTVTNGRPVTSTDVPLYISAFGLTV